MRLVLVSLLLLAATACSRSQAPAQAANGKPAPGSLLAATSAPAAPASVAAAAPVAVDAATGQPEAPPDKSDQRWQDVDPNTLGGRDENALADFQAQQRKRDAELMARDADEANARVAQGTPRDERTDERYAQQPYAQQPYADDRYADRRDEDRRYDPREDERDYGDEPYYGDLPPDEDQWDEGPYDEPPPYDDEDYPPVDEDEDPYYDPRYQRPYR